LITTRRERARRARTRPRRRHRPRHGRAYRTQLKRPRHPTPLRTATQRRLTSNAQHRRAQHQQWGSKRDPHSCCHYGCEGLQRFL